MIIVTTDDVPGYDVVAVHGEVFGLTVRSRNAFSHMGAGLKSMVGGELKGMARNLEQSRHEVMGRLAAAAEARGANAVLAMRFDTSEVGGVWTEICAYGTAVRVVPHAAGSPPGAV
ncbi:MAG: YbjQ family protein [Actinomycetota bacterium]|nr:YbjQ family protein [Actinomycetota bacterium]